MGGATDAQGPGGADISCRDSAIGAGDLRPATARRGLRCGGVRVAVVDIGTNSTRLLIADVAEGRIAERDRRSRVTRLGQGVDATGALADEAVERVFGVLDEYHEAIMAEGCEVTTAVLTSAVRDASNGDWFRAEVNRRY